MRNVIVSNIMSIDGYFEGPGRNVMALPMDGFFDEQNLERLRASDTVLYGATTYRLMLGYWPRVAADPSASPVVAANPALAELHRETALRLQDTPKIVVSDSMAASDTGPWATTTEIVRRAEAHRAIAALKEQPGRDILIFGSHILWNDLAAAGLIDELHLMIGARALGGGTPIFAGALPPMRLLDVRRRDGSDNVLVRYRMTASTRSERAA